jgi:large subunit ribosomal protein L14
MITQGTYLSVVDNSGAKKAYCIKIIKGYKSRYAFLGDIILVSIHKLRAHRKSFSKVKTGELYKAIIVRTKFKKLNYCGDSYQFLDNAIVLLNKQNKFIGTRVFGTIPKFFRYTKYMRLVSISSGLVS